MSFLKSPIRRFNELPILAPPPGTYDPKFLTDVSETASKGMPRSRSSFGLKSKDSSTNKIASNRNSIQSLGSGSETPPSDPHRPRSSSQQRSSSPYSASSLLRRNISHSQPPFRRVPTASRSRTTGSHNIHKPLRSDQNLSIASTQTSTLSVKDSCPTESELQKELEASTKLLNEARERNRLLQAEIDANIPILADMKAQFEKLRIDSEISDKKYQERIKILMDSKTGLEQLLETQRAQLSELMDKKLNTQLQGEALHTPGSDKVSDRDSEISQFQANIKAQNEYIEEIKEERKQLLMSIDVCNATIEKDTQEKHDLNEEIKKLKSKNSTKTLLQLELQRQAEDDSKSTQLETKLSSLEKDRIEAEETLQNCIEEQKEVIKSFMLNSTKIEMTNKSSQTEANGHEDIDKDSIIAALLSKESAESSVGTTDPMLTSSYDPTVHDQETDINNNIIERPIHSSSSNKSSPNRKMEVTEEILGKSMDDEGSRKIVTMKNAVTNENKSLRRLIGELSPENTRWEPQGHAETTPTTETVKEEELNGTFQEGEARHEQGTEVKATLGPSEQDDKECLSHGNNWSSRSRSHRANAKVGAVKSGSQGQNQGQGIVPSPSGSSIKGRKDVKKNTSNVKVDKVVKEDN